MNLVLYVSYLKKKIHLWIIIFNLLLFQVGQFVGCYLYFIKKIKSNFIFSFCILFSILFILNNHYIFILSFFIGWSILNIREEFCVKLPSLIKILFRVLGIFLSFLFDKIFLSFFFKRKKD